MVMQSCRSCGLLLSAGVICSVCEIGENGGMVHIWKHDSWISSIFAEADIDMTELPEPSCTMLAIDFAEFVRVERRERGLI